MDQDWEKVGNYYIHHGEQGTDDWLAARKFRLTMSNLATALGLSIFDSPVALARQITLLEEKEFSAVSLAHMERGKKYEPVVRDWYSRRIGKTIIERGLAVPSWEPKIGASVDGEIDDQTIIEIKCPARMYRNLKNQVDQHVLDPERRHIYRSHYCQMQGNMAITGTKTCVYLVCDIDSGQVYIEKVPFNLDYWNKTLYPGIQKFIHQYLDPYYQKYIDQGGQLRRIDIPLERSSEDI